MPNDAQISFPKILKPIPNFEAIYQGQQGSRLIAFPGGIDEMSEAAEPGFDPHLQKGVEVPYGSRLVVWIPIMTNAPAALYKYRFVWRLRNVLDYRANRKPFHLTNQRPGVPDTTGGAPGVARFIMVAGSQVLAYEQPEPAIATDAAEVNLRNQWFVPQAGFLDGSAPLDASGTATILSQGVLDPATVIRANQPLWNVFRVDAEGDELIILCKRQDDAAAWDFQSVDQQFADFYGTGGGSHTALPNLGIYVFAGTNP